MLKQFKYKDVTWIDLEKPTASEIDQLGRDYDLESRVLSELATNSRRSKLDVYTNYFYLVLHFPREIDFVVGKDFIITTHYELVNEINDFSKIFETDLRLKRNGDNIHAGFILAHIIRELYGSLQTDLQHVNDKLRAIETRVFSNHERDAVRDLFAVNHQLLDWRWALKSHHEILENLVTETEDFFGTRLRYHLKSLVGEYSRSWHALESNQTTLESLQTVTESLLTLKTNDTIKALTVAAFIFLPVTLISQILGMNTGGLPLVDSPQGFNFALALMAASVGVLYYLARRRQWF